ncbi:MAG: dihydrofolate reductase [Vezdaea acicularis]|nr:MAG: dihydrofolate reductase [Vezdaea acicularis]
MAASHSSSIPLTIIVASTLQMGIGRGSNLPWPLLRKEMAHFARTTKLTPSEPYRQVASHTSRKIEVRNAVIMGRKTWESIPPKFRPLKGRINVVITHNVNKLEREIDKHGDQDDKVIIVGGLEEALKALWSLDNDLDNTGLGEGGMDGAKSSKSQHQGTETGEPERSQELGRVSKFGLGHVFVIGGASIYDLALQLPQTRSILWTRVLTPFDCDTFFPINLENPAESEWESQNSDQLESWLGRKPPSGIQTEEGVSYEFHLLSKA